MKTNEIIPGTSGKNKSKKEKWEQYVHAPISMGKRFIKCVKKTSKGIIDFLRSELGACVIGISMGLIIGIPMCMSDSEQKAKWEQRNFRMISGEVKEVNYITTDGAKMSITFSDGRTMSFRGGTNDLIQKGKINKIYYSQWLFWGENEIDSVRIK